MEASALFKRLPTIGRMIYLRPMKSRNIGMLLLAIYLLLVGLIGVAGISLGQLQIVVPILALAAGVFLLIGK